MNQALYKMIRKWIIIGLIALALIIAATMFGCPKYNVWQQTQKGIAELRRAEQNRQIQIEEAQAELESAGLLAQAEVLRAEGVRDANLIIADGLGGPEGYLRYLFIQGLREAELGGQVIYVPTEGMMPILEAGRLR